MSLKSLKIDESNLLNPDLATSGAAQDLRQTFVLSTLLSMTYRKDIRKSVRVLVSVLLSVQGFRLG